MAPFILAHSKDLVTSLTGEAFSSPHDLLEEVANTTRRA